MVGVFSHMGRCRQDNGRNCSTVAQLYSQDFWMQSSSSFSPRNNCYKTDENKAFLKKIFGTFRGFSFRGLSFRGLSFRCLSFLCLSFLCLSFRGLSFRGLSFRGLSFRGLSFQGLRFRGLSFRGLSFGLLEILHFSNF